MVAKKKIVKADACCSTDCGCGCKGKGVGFILALVVIALIWAWPAAFQTLWSKIVLTVLFVIAALAHTCKCNCK